MWGPDVGNFFELSCSAQHPPRLIERISKLYMLMMIPFYKLQYPDPTDFGVVDATTAPSLEEYPRLAFGLLVFLMDAELDTGIEGLFVLTANLLPVFIGRSGYSEPLMRFLRAGFLQRQTNGTFNLRSPKFGFASLPMEKYFRTLMPSISQYLEVRFTTSL